MDAGDLKFFEAVARLGGMNRAAAELNTVQSNVTSRIRALEAELGTMLFHRHARGVSPTAAAQRLLPYAAQVRSLLDDACRAVGDDGRPAGPLVIGSLETTVAVRTRAPARPLCRRLSGRRSLAAHRHDVRTDRGRAASSCRGRLCLWPGRSPGPCGGSDFPRSAGGADRARDQQSRRTDQNRRIPHHRYFVRVVRTGCGWRRGWRAEALSASGCWSSAHWRLSSAVSVPALG